VRGWVHHLRGGGDEVISSQSDMGMGRDFSSLLPGLEIGRQRRHQYRAAVGGESKRTFDLWTILLNLRAKENVNLQQS
jgi:hypothetical protein